MRRSHEPRRPLLRQLPIAAAGAMLLLATAGAAQASEGFPYRRVSLGATAGCWPVATTLALQDEGLMGVAHPTRPMLFVFRPAAPYAFWMQDTPAPLNGVWIGTGQTVIGRWHGIPNTTTQHVPPAPVAAVIEYPVGWRVPPNGARLAVGDRCSSTDGL